MRRSEAESIVRDSPAGAFANEIISELSPGIRLKLSSVLTPLSTGASRFGGQPDLPPDGEWPTWDPSSYLVSQITQLEKRRLQRPGKYINVAIEHLEAKLAVGPRYLSLLAQINLRDIPAVEATRSLPNQGLLLFFYCADLQPWGFDPSTSGAWKVVFYDGDFARLSRLAKPAVFPETSVGKECRVDFEPVFNLPQTIVIPGAPKLRLWEEPLKSLNIKLQGQSSSKQHQLVGKPFQIQGPMELTCQMAANGIFCGGPEAYQDPRRIVLEQGASDWQLLFQMDSDEENVGWMWGDTGMIYFWIRKQDLATRDFDRTWFQLQCF